MSVKKPYKFGFLGAVTLTIICMLFIVLRAPHLAESYTLDLIEASGFEEAHIEHMETGLGFVSLKNIKLDKDALNTIDSLSLQFDPFALILKGKVQTATITGLTLIGEISEDGLPDFSGRKNTSPSSLMRAAFNIEEIHIKSAGISLLSERSGGISLHIDGQTALNEKDMEARFTMTNTQRQMRYNANITAKVNRQLNWQADIEIPDIRLETGSMKATRASGELKIVSTGSSQDAQINGELRAGSAIFGGLPWTNPAITVTGSALKPSLIIATKAAGFEEIELGIAIDDTSNPDKISGYIYTPTWGSFIDYLNQNDANKVHSDAIEPFRTTQEVQINFETHEGNIEFEYNSTHPQLALLGFAQIAESEGQFKLKSLAVKTANGGKLSLNKKQFEAILSAEKQKRGLFKNIENMHYDEIAASTTLSGKGIKEKNVYKVQIKGNSGIENFSLKATPEEILNAFKPPAPIMQDEDITLPPLPKEAYSE